MSEFPGRCTVKLKLPWTVIITLLGILFPPFVLAATNTYYVSTSGNNSFPGNQNQPFLTIQKCLDTVQPGDTCMIHAGTYHESLTLKASGTDSKVITVRSYNNESVTIDSGDQVTVQISPPYQSYYTFDGLRFISSLSSDINRTATIDFERDWNPATQPPDGSNHITLRNCYVEGAARFLGHNNLVENCEFNGKGKLANGIMFHYKPNQNNIIRNNKVHDYTRRGIWSMSDTLNTLIENNTVYNVSIGINCDGANIANHQCNVIGNTISSLGYVNNTYGWGTGIMLENNFDSIIENNTIFNSHGSGIYVINYGIGYMWDGHTVTNTEYRTIDLNTTIRNNVISNFKIDGIEIDGASGAKLYNNTFYTQQPSITAIRMHDNTYMTYFPKNWDIRNNIFFTPTANNSFVFSNQASVTGTTISHNLFSPDNSKHKVGATVYNTLSEFQSSTGQGADSLTADPLFVNPGEGDFHLQPNSPAMNIGAYASQTQSSKPGDANGDNQVDETDYQIWYNHFGQQTSGASVGDFNSSSIVDGIDYVIWLNHYGT